jgi:anti-anti-sigma factor
VRGDRVSVEQQLEGRLTVLRLRGEIDVANVPVVEHAMIAACDGDSPPSDVLVDFSEVLFFDARILGLLAATATRLRAGSCRLTVRGLTDHQERVFRICGLDDLLAATVELPH